MSDQKPNWFKKHKVLTIVGGVIFLIVIVSALSGGAKSPASNKTASKTAATQTGTKQEQKPAVRQAQGTQVTLGAGTFAGGKDVAVGLYDVTAGAGQTGNFIVSGADTYNEILGDAGAAGGVSKVRTRINSGDKIQLSSLSSVTFTPVTAAFSTDYKVTNLYAGTFIVGEDIGAGRYTVTPGSGQTGNFIVTGANMYNEILGGDSSFGGVPSVSATLTKGDKIAISGMDQVTFTPAN